MTPNPRSSGGRKGGPWPSLGLERSLWQRVWEGWRGEMGGSSEQASPELRPQQWERNRQVEAGWRGRAGSTPTKARYVRRHKSRAESPDALPPGADPDLG